MIMGIGVGEGEGRSWGMVEAMVSLKVWGVVNSFPFSGFRVKYAASASIIAKRNIFSIC